VAISITTDLVDISNADTTTTGGTFYRLNGVNTGNPAAEPDARKQGVASMAYKGGATTGTTDTGGHFNATANFDLTNQHVFHWRNNVTPANMATKANRGVAFGLTNTSTTSTAAWSTTNYKLWFLDGSDTETDGGWKCYVVNPAGTANVSAGTLTLNAVRNCGFINRQLTGVNTALNNILVDAIRRGTGLTATASSAADTITFANLYATDSTNSNAWGIITQNAGIYYGAGTMRVGSAAQANTCLFKDTNQVLVWRDFPVANTLYSFTLAGAASQRTTFQLGNKTGTSTSDGCVVRGQGTAVWNVVCDANSDFDAYACTFARMRAATLSSGSELRDTAFSACGTIDTNGATIASCTFSAHTATQLKLDAASEATPLSSLVFTSGGTGHAIEITAAGTYTLTGHTFTGYAASNGSTGNETIHVNLASGTVNISVDSAISVRTAGATVNVTVGQKTLTVTNVVSGSDVVILAAGTDTVLAINDGATNPVTSFAYTYSYSAGVNVDVAVYKAGYVPYIVRNYLLENGNASLPAAQVVDRNYTP
jgi:spore maturation protein SpmB